MQKIEEIRSIATWRLGYSNWHKKPWWYKLKLQIEKEMILIHIPVILKNDYRSCIYK